MSICACRKGKTMKKYERPVIIKNEELAEGVYAASGASVADCYSASCSIHQRPENGRGDYRIQMNAVHAAADGHHSGKQTFIISFNQPVEYVYSNGTLSSGDGTGTLSIDFEYHNNGYDNIGAGDLVVKSEQGLAITGVSVPCNHDCGQH